ncbi:hypothetical protein T439DRAFT_273512, partial [Meredithblackwellia eburnea MCA 4105]
FIINLYRPGQGISPHVDLLDRFEDGIVGLSLLGSATMEFTPDAGVDEDEDDAAQPGDCYVLTGQARYGWNHSIPARLEDVYMEEGVAEPVTLRRRTRISITIRRMKTGADIVG